MGQKKILLGVRGGEGLPPWPPMVVNGKLSSPNKSKMRKLVQKMRRILWKAQFKWVEFKPDGMLGCSVCKDAGIKNNPWAAGLGTGNKRGHLQQRERSRSHVLALASAGADVGGSVIIKKGKLVPSRKAFRGVLLEMRDQKKPVTKCEARFARMVFVVILFCFECVPNWLVRS